MSKARQTATGPNGICYVARGEFDAETRDVPAQSVEQFILRPDVCGHCFGDLPLEAVLEHEDRVRIITNRRHAKAVHAIEDVDLPGRVVVISEPRPSKPHYHATRVPGRMTVCGIHNGVISGELETTDPAALNAQYRRCLECYPGGMD